MKSTDKYSAPTADVIKFEPGVILGASNEHMNEENENIFGA